MHALRRVVERGGAGKGRAGQVTHAMLCEMEAERAAARQADLREESGSQMRGHIG